MQTYSFAPHQELPERTAQGYQEDYLRRTIEVKNSNIDQLLKELKETQTLYQGYKTEYLGEERRLKTKVSELASRLDLQSGEIQKLKLTNGKIREDLQTCHEKENKMMEAHLMQSREQAASKRQLEDRCRELLRENAETKERNEGLATRFARMEERCMQAERESADCQAEVSQLKQEIGLRRGEWLEERRELVQRIQEEEERRQKWQRVNKKLDRLEQKVINNIRKI